MKKNLRKLQQKIRKLMLLAVLGLLACGLTAFAFTHRRVIRAALKGEKLPEPPKGHPCHPKKA